MALPPRIVREPEVDLVTLIPKALLQPAAHARHERPSHFGFARCARQNAGDKSQPDH
jgi:hypothetical protein